MRCVGSTQSSFVLLQKVIVSKGERNSFAFLPPGWISFNHETGIVMYLHKDTRVITLSKPYSAPKTNVKVTRFTSHLAEILNYLSSCLL